MATLLGNSRKSGRDGARPSQDGLFPVPRNDNMAHDPHRPTYHFMPPCQWINDPNGLIQWKGQYHLFYQHNPAEAFFGRMHWGHAVSTDLVHWRHLPIALTPSPEGADKDGVYSGCIVDDHGVPTALYTGVHPEVQCLATGTDDLVSWEKHPGNPVIPAPPPGLAVTGFRDPWVWREGELWYMVIGSGIAGVGGAALLYRSADLRQWDYRGPLYVGSVGPGDTMWECPCFFPLGNRAVLMVSACGGVHAWIGDYAAERFVPTRCDRVDAGLYYAAQAFRDDRNRRIVFAWVTERRGERAALVASGWAGMLSLPRVLSLGNDGGLGVAPAEELNLLRGRHRSCPPQPIAGCTPLPPEIGGSAVEVEVSISPGSASVIELAVRRSANGEEQGLIRYDLAEQALSWHTDQGSLAPSLPKPAFKAGLRLASGEPLRLRVYVDRSVVEIYANNRIALTGCIYPSRADSTGVALLAHGGEAHLERLDCWEMP